MDLSGFVLGIVASGIAGIIFERAMNPMLEIVVDPGSRALADLADGTKLEYHHLIVRNARARWPLQGRRPAWACQANISVFRWSGEPVISTPIRARWASQPEPVSSYIVGTQVVLAADVAKIIAGRRIDIYSHQDERLTVALKHQGQSSIHLFTNESYKFERGCNPEWRLETGTYRLHVTVHYDRGTLRRDFELSNTGPMLEDVTISAWSANETA